jgi:predicted CopG family antitoxin
MAHRTLTISEEAYNALSNLKNKNESFTDVILRLSKQEEIGKLSDLIKKIAPDQELADNIEKASTRMRRTKLRKVIL